MLVIRWRPPTLSMVQLLPWSFGLSSFVLLPFALIMERPSTWGIPVVAALGYVGVIAEPIGTWCYLLTMAHLPVVVASMGLLMTPAVGLMLSTWWFGEPLGPDFLARNVMILGGVAVSILSGKAR